MEVEITKREVIASVTIIVLMLLIGVLLFGKIVDYEMDINEKYNKAIKIESTDLFQYGMNTNVGYAFVYGDLIALDPVTYSEIENEYLSVKKVKERYTMHTRTVTTTDVNGKTHTRTETYWTWDAVGSEVKTAKKIEFCGVDFNSSQFRLPSRDYIRTIRESSHVRYKYYGSPTKSTGTIFANLQNKNIGEEEVPYYINRNIEETMKLVTSDISLVLFWVLWVILIGFVVFGFYYLDNKWLND